MCLLDKLTGAVVCEAFWEFLCASRSLRDVCPWHGVEKKSSARSVISWVESWWHHVKHQSSIMRWYMCTCVHVYVCMCVCVYVCIGMGCTLGATKSKTRIVRKKQVVLSGSQHIDARQDLHRWWDLPVLGSLTRTERAKKAYEYRYLFGNSI